MRFRHQNRTPQIGKYTLLLYSIVMARATKFLDAFLSFLDRRKKLLPYNLLVYLNHHLS